MWPTNNRWSFHLSLGGWSLSHTLFLHFTTFLWQKTVWQILFNVKATMFYTCKTDFFPPNSRPLRCRLQSLLSVFVKPVCSYFSDCERLCQCLHVCLYTCPCIHNLLRSVSYFNTTECSSYTQRGGKRSLNASSWSTTLDYNCQEWQLEKRNEKNLAQFSQTNYFTTQKCVNFLFQRYKIKRYE